jgi:hypothetical protein
MRDEKVIKISELGGMSWRETFLYEMRSFTVINLKGRVDFVNSDASYWSPRDALPTCK